MKRKDNGNVNVYLQTSAKEYKKPNYCNLSCSESEKKKKSNPVFELSFDFQC